MVGIPTLLHVALVWIPTISSILPFLHQLEGIRLSEITLGRTEELSPDIHASSSAISIRRLLNNIVLMIFLFVFPTALGIFFAYLLDKNIRGTRIYQAVYFTPVVLSLAVVGFMWKSVIYSTANGLATQLFGHGKAVDWLGNQSYLIPIGDYGISHNFVYDPDCHRLAAYGLHYGALSGWAEERRSVAAGSIPAGW